MKISCTGRKVALKDSFIERVEGRLGKLDKFFGEEAEATVTVTVEKKYQTVEITVREGGFVARAERSAPQMEEAFDAAADVLTHNIVKNRKRISDRLQRAVPADFYPNEEQDEVFDAIREKHFVVGPASVEEAILQMNLLGHNFYLFRDVDDNEINVIYKRKDGNYGLLIPE